MVHPIIDEYYNSNPYHSRSSQLVHDRGLVSNEKNAVNGTTIPDSGRKPSNLHESIDSTLASSLHAALVSPALSSVGEKSIARQLSPLSHVRNLPLSKPCSQTQGKV